MTLTLTYYPLTKSAVNISQEILTQVKIIALS